jgi:thymidylate synthase
MQGDLGPASYAVLHDFPTPDGYFNQVQALIDQIRELPHLKTHTITTLYPPGIFRGKGKKQQVVTVPCHGTVINVTILNDLLNFEVVNRSTDILLGEVHDRLMYGTIWLALCHATGYRPGILSIVFLNAHYYGNQREVLEMVVSREPRPFPTVTLQDPPDNFFDFRKTHFKVTDYNPHPAITNIPLTS